jgi:hypothetical protein
MTKLTWVLVLEQRTNKFHMAILTRPPKCCSAIRVSEIDIKGLVLEQRIDNFQTAIHTRQHKRCVMLQSF